MIMNEYIYIYAYIHMCICVSYVLMCLCMCVCDIYIYIELCSYSQVLAEQLFGLPLGVVAVSGEPAFLQI